MKFEYSKPYITDTTLATILGGSEDRRYSWVKRALKSGVLMRLKRGIYLVPSVAKSGPLIDTFELAQHLYGPSYISLESALAHHGWIPEAVYTITSVCPKRDQTIHTHLGVFRYEHTPLDQFFMGIDRVTSSTGVSLIAHPWKAMADYVYVNRKTWTSLKQVIRDLRLDESVITKSERIVLEEVATYYDSPRVSRFARNMLKDL